MIIGIPPPGCPLLHIGQAQLQRSERRRCARHPCFKNTGYARFVIGHRPSVCDVGRTRTGSRGRGCWPMGVGDASPRLRTHSRPDWEPGGTRGRTLARVTSNSACRLRDVRPISPTKQFADGGCVLRMYALPPVITNRTTSSATASTATLTLATAALQAVVLAVLLAVPGQHPFVVQFQYNFSTQQ